MGFILSSQLDTFIDENTSPQDEVLLALERETHLNFRLPQMLSGKVQGRFLNMVTGMIRPSLMLEIGTYTGYSSICFARGLAENGKLITIDIDEELSDTVLKYAEKAGLSHKIDLKIGKAMDIIGSIDGPLDMVFIDADKVNYSNYYDLVFPKVRIGGYILADNVLWSGKVVDEKKDKDTKALMDYSAKVQNDDRVENVLLSVRDGIMLAKKISD